MWLPLLSGAILLSGISFATETSQKESSRLPVVRARSQFPVIPPTFVDPRPAPLAREHVFKLRHVIHHGTYEYPDLHIIQNVNPEAGLLTVDDDGIHARDFQPLRARSRGSTIQRLSDRSPEHIESLLKHGQMTGQAMTLDSDAWTFDEIPEPDASDKDTVLTFARVAANAYVQDDTQTNWDSLTGRFNFSLHFGWEKDGLRGHIFTDEDNSTIIVGLKGTSPALFDGSETTGNDKLNDNLFFSCCCGQGGQYWWREVCNCQSSAYTCNSTCVTTALRDRNRYYYAAQDLFRNVTAMYPNSQVWLAGHSLGGAVSSLLGLTFGVPVFTFEAPGEAMPAARLGLPVPPGYELGFHQQRSHTGSYHFGHTADPIYMGTCNTAGSFCTLAGYAMESVCHTGYSCVYDTVEDLGWRAGIGTHRIRSVINDVILKYDEVPKCQPRPDCVDCYNWKYFESNHSSPTTTGTTTPKPTSTTRTETCKTPGWWGCLDETTTTQNRTQTITTTSCRTTGWFGCKDPTTITTITTVTPTTTSTTTPTSTCKTPGWFSCLDPTTTSDAAAPGPTSDFPSVTHTSGPSLTSSTWSSPSSTTTSCETPGWFGCLDPTTTGDLPSSSTESVSPTPTTSCETPGWFGCLDPSPTEPVSSPVDSATATPSPSQTCQERTWYGRCRRWGTHLEL